MISLLHRFGARMARPLRGEEGNVLIMVGLLTFLLIMAVGVAIDMTRAQILQQRMSASLDAAGLAAAETVSTPPASLNCTPSSSTDTTCNQEWANQEAARFFNANFPAGYLGSSVSAPSVALSNGVNTLTLQVSGSQQPVIMQTFGFNSINVTANSTVTRSSNGQGVELVLALDNTGSMACDTSGNNCDSGPNSKIVGLQNALTGTGGLLDILYGGNPTVQNLFVGIVPFSQAVNVGTNNLVSAAFDNSYNASLPFDTTNPNGTWSGCVTSRSPTSVDATNGLTYDLSDIPPSGTSGTKFQDYFFAPSQVYNVSTGTAGYTPAASSQTDAACYGDYNQLCFWNQWQTSASASGNNYNASQFNVISPNMGPNVLCPGSPVLPMQSQRSMVQSAISTMTTSGDTEINVGLAWAWRLLSPQWQGLWNDSVMTSNNPPLPLPYNTANFIKVIVLMTDGTNFIDSGSYSAYGFYNQGTLGSGYISAANGTSQCPSAGYNEPAPPNAHGDGPEAQACAQAAALDLDNRTSQLCTYLKSQNVVIFTIGFGTPAANNPPLYSDRTKSTVVDEPLLQACAGGTANGVTGQYYTASNISQLYNAFVQIGNAIENIRISH